MKIWLVLILILSGCAYSQKGIEEKVHTVYMAQKGEAPLISKFSPVFLTYNHRESYNRIGRPSAKANEKMDVKVYVDPGSPAIYFMRRNFSTAKGSYTNLIYRIHFSEVPYSLIPFHLTAGQNVGLIFVITVDENQRPLLFTTAGTCGCYAAIVPTSYLPKDAYPEAWKNEPLEVYGEELPPLLDYEDMSRPSLLVHLRSAVHRVMDIEVVEKDRYKDREQFTIIKAPLLPTDALERIPVNGTDGETTSFYYVEGAVRGHVKGSIKPWASLFLSLISLDFFVGTDKAYGDRRVTGNPFYTSLKPWNRHASDMGDFATFLKFWGWRL
jgi:hypothetical protein